MSADFHGYCRTIYPRKSVQFRVHPRALFGVGFFSLVALTSLMTPTLIAQTSQQSTRSGIYTAAQAERGRMQYALSCRSCHTAASHTGVTFAKWWKDRTVADLYAYMSTQMPKNDPGSLEPEQYADVIAYLLKMNAMPPGTAELLADSSALAQIRIEVPLKTTPATAPKTQKQPQKPTRKTRP
jgi:mono/diheme cytochrome c family protein